MPGSFAVYNTCLRLKKQPIWPVRVLPVVVLLRAKPLGPPRSGPEEYYLGLEGYYPELLWAPYGIGPPAIS